MKSRNRRAGLGMFVGLVAGIFGPAPGTVRGAEITSVRPAVVCKTGGERISIEGRGFTRTMVPKLDGADFPAHEFRSETLWEATLPVLGSLDFHTVSLIEDRTEVAVSLRAFGSISAIFLRSCDPTQIPETGGTLLRILGDGFRPVEKIAVTVGGMPATVLFVSADGTAMNCVAPAGAPGAADVVVENDACPPASLPITYVRSVSLTDVSPSLVCVAGTTELTFTGSAFKPTDVPRIGVTPLDRTLFVDERTLRGTVPPSLAPGFYSAGVADDRGVPLTPPLPAAVEIVAAPEITSIAPDAIPIDGGIEMTIRGRSFRPVSEGTPLATVGGKLLAGAVLSADGTTITGIAPANAAGPRDVVVNHPVCSRAVRIGGANYLEFREVTISHVEPPFICAEGMTKVIVHGSGFRAGDAVSLGGPDTIPASTQRFIGPGGIEVTVNGSYQAWFYDVLIEETSPRRILASLNDAVEVIEPPAIDSIAPGQASLEGGTVLTIRGRFLRPGALVRIGGKPAGDVQVAVDGRDRSIATITCTAPPGDAPGPVEVVIQNVVCALIRRSDLLVYEALPVISSMDPLIACTAGGTSIEIRGKNFAAGQVVRVGGKPLINQRLISSTLITGLTPPLDKTDDGELDITDSLGMPKAIGPTLGLLVPPVILSVHPRQVSIRGGDFVSIQGEGFNPPPGLHLPEVISPPLDFIQVSRDGKTITGVVPPHAVGPADIAVKTGGICAPVVLSGALTYIDEAPSDVPPPSQFETSLAEGTARFRWHNPTRYKEILVLDEGGAFVAKLASGVSTLEIPTRGSDSVLLKFQGSLDDGRKSPLTFGRADKLQCDRPAPLNGEGFLGVVDLPLKGGHAPANVVRCPGPPGGGAASPPPIGLVDFANFPKADRNKVVTGFVLEEDADRLEIAGFYEKIATDFGLSLRGHLIHVYPQDGFRDEFTFPDVLIEKGKEWNSITYYRANKDVGVPGEPESEDPAKLPPVACKDPSKPDDDPCNVLKIPKGEYLLEIYAVGADHLARYYSFADDGRDEDLLIPGSPCPPYPLVRVTDLTGHRTLPEILKLESEVLPVSGPSKIFCQGIRVKFTAFGSWFDEACGLHDLPGETDSRFEFTWKVYAKENPQPVLSGSNPFVIACVPDWGCYQVDVTVADKACGISKKRSFEMPLYPEFLFCDDDQGYTFQDPTPEPGSIYALAGLNPPPSTGVFQGERPVNFRVLVLPCDCGLSDDQIKNCPGAMEDDLEFQLALKQNGKVVLEPEDIEVLDLCKNQSKGPKYFSVSIDDLGKIADIPGSIPGGPDGFKEIVIQARKKNTGSFQTIGNPFFMSNPPSSLLDGESYWSGSFNPEDSSYHFTVKTTPQAESNFPSLPDSSEVPFPIEEKQVTLPSASNAMAAGFVSRFIMQGGVWGPGEATGSQTGEFMGNQMTGAPLKLQSVQEKAEQGGGLPQGGSHKPFPHYEWCDQGTIYENHFETSLFNSIIYAGTVGPVPITVWASIGLSLDVCIQYYTSVFLRPFAEFDGGGHHVETDFYLITDVNLQIPCEIRADIAFGILSIAARLVPEAEVDFDVHSGSVETAIEKDLFLGAFLSLYFEMEVCALTLHGEFCLETPKAYLLEDEPLVTYSVGNANQPYQEIDYCAEDGSGKVSLAVPECVKDPSFPFAPKGGGVTPGVHFTINAPVTVTSPDGENTIDLWINGDGTGEMRMNESDPNGFNTFFPGIQGEYRDPAAAWLSSQAALIAYSETLDEDIPSNLGLLPVDWKSNPDPLTKDQRNLIARQEEILVVPLTYSQGFWKLGDPVRIADVVAEVPSFLNRRPDGKVSLAGDLSTETAWAVWVRYEGDFLVMQGGVSYWEPGVVQGKNGLVKVDTVAAPRPQLDKTAIYARRIGLNGPLGPAVKLSPPGDGINIEPIVSFSPSGKVGYCIWVHDSSGHTDLITSNRGRRLLYSIYTEATGSWSPPMDLLAHPEDLPGLIEPTIRIKSDSNGLANGLAAFTALYDKNTPENDTGLAGSSTYTYVCRIENGVIGDPVRIHRKCQKRVYTHWTKILDIPDEANPDVPGPGIVEMIMFQETGPLGGKAGSGDISVAVLGEGMTEFSPPIALTKPDEIDSNGAGSIVDGKLRTIHLNGGKAAQPRGGRLGRGGGGGLPGPRSFVSSTFALEPDLVLAACRLSEPFAAPGATVKATVKVENLGLVASPVNAGGVSLTGVELVYMEADGRERLVASGLLPRLVPGESTELTIEIEMPHDPVRLRAQLNPNPVDRDRTNNARACFLGTPAPRDFACEAVLPGTEALTPAARLTWRCDVPCDEHCIYRDGLLLAQLPGGCRSFVDPAVPTGPHTYEIRSRFGASKSSWATCEIEIRPTVPPGARFRRGDADGSGVLDITDAIQVLNFLFTCREPCPPLGCADAADADDNGVIEITDPVRILNFLFLAGLPTPTPGPLACGIDPGPDGLDPCEQPACP